MIDDLPMPAGYFKLVVQLFGTTPARHRGLLDGTGVAAEALAGLGGEITAGQQLQQIRNASALLPPGWGLELGAHFEAATHGYVGFGAVSAGTLGEGLELVERFTSVRNPALEAVGERQGDEFHLVYRPRCELLDEERYPLLESYFLSIQAILESILAAPLDPARLELVGRPEHAGLYRKHFRARIVFDAERDALVIPAAWLERRSPLADPDIYGASKRMLQEMADRLAGEAFVGARVASLLASGSDAGPPMETVARLLGISSRTLIRRLGEAGTTYRALRDAHRRSRAEVLLRSSRLPVAEIASRLGYEGASNFGRACRRWFGCTPRTMRERLQGRSDDRGAGPDLRGGFVDCGSGAA